ncbi:MAG: PIN domain-containing protein [Thermoplasmatota archaeon]
MTNFFFDTYALLRCYLRAESYAPFKDEPISTERGCLYEFAGVLLAAEGAAGILPAIRAMRANRLDPTDDDFVAASKLRLQHPRWSRVDALGYVLADRLGYRFLTGDSAFRNVPNVEFVR